jgi:hypothetical protein
LNKGTNKKKTHAQIKTIEQRYIQEENTRTYKKQKNKGTNKRKTHAHIKTIEQRYKQEENTGTDKNNSVVFICACVFLLYAPLFNCIYLCVCFPLVCTFVQLFLSVRVFSSCLYLCSIVSICKSVSSYMHFCSIVFILNKGTNKRKTNAQIKTIEQMYKQEENTRTDKNN